MYFYFSYQSFLLPQKMIFSTLKALSSFINLHL